VCVLCDRLFVVRRVCATAVAMIAPNLCNEYNVEGKFPFWRAFGQRLKVRL